MVFFLMTYFILFFAYVDEQALQFGNYSTMLKKRKPSKKVLLDITDQCFQHERQTEKKGAFENFKKKNLPSFSVSQEFHSGCCRCSFTRFYIHLLTVPSCFKRTSRCLNLSFHLQRGVLCQGKVS